MLDFIYYPVSWILWVWHKVFGAVLGADNGFAWALSVMFLVFTLRLILYKPFVKQVRTTRQMQELQPQIKALQKKYGKDKQRMAVEMQKLQKEHGFNPIMGCLPVLAQAPVFIGLFHVLRSFNRTGTGVGQLGLDPAVNRTLPNYAFNVEDVNSFLDARLFGAPISAWITMPKAQLEAFANPELGLGVPSVWTIVAVSVPLMVIAAVATHLNSRASVARQSEAAAANPQSAIMNKLALYIFPLGVLVFGAFLPIAILLYWVSNNLWTYGQQHLVFGKIDREEEEKKKLALEKRTENAPKPGVKPVTKPKPGARPKLSKMTPPPVADAAEQDGTSDLEANPSDSTPPAGGNGAARPKGQRPQPNRNRPKRKRR
ncbi:membrane protein insertase YidC [Rhodococcus sp. BP-252]|uniref:membrane protein insertase YidC n=1 Tax=unclassified Rhodococcus (in: high G+C Gram-positive bacteria) TaxID=192944 RepID=UPI001C9AA470|nr:MULTISPECIES: membrane protein insertase YidC [unclassified Rhodococcus (in: high G+C Gram-positive bacteria)]MBY6411933.1 membrane protein insertase YidC [Rhodococcus sp. BP-320]MBY6416439.1 membrane protein insertase YidC [Rhodococcus sp. BP-321]MBY6420755.1 membrane protein insertase YidC [Rhodococcus sp. BP-324]MBY6426463.1 membrane protein insertase YidC [Rhodococcus sp. BP-323]MBY6431462.1 membrane protein insertase YidC [Rhodococcus sp. BP-322]